MATKSTHEGLKRVVGAPALAAIVINNTIPNHKILLVYKNSTRR